MGVYKDKERGTWFVSYRYVDALGEHQRRVKRGFRTRAEALQWEREDRDKQEFSTKMKLFKFYELYEQDVRHRTKESTWDTKQHIIETKILPYLGNMEISQINPRTIRKWQDTIMKFSDENGKPYSSSSSKVKCEKELLVLIYIPAFPMAARYINCKAKCNYNGSGNRCKTKIHFTPFKVEINFSLQCSHFLNLVFTFFEFI